jgi:CRP/FNR family cyclic AMP-dependent transcriptional regulator
MANHLADVTALQKVPLFAELDVAHLRAILAVSETRHVRKDAVICRQGEKGDALFLILAGRVKAVLLAEDGREVILAVLEPGEIFGEMALFDMEERRSATVIAAEECTLLSLSGKAFLDVLRDHPSIALAMLRSLTQRLKETSARIGNLIFLDTYSRVGSHLVALAGKHGRKLADGSVLVTRPTHQEIAHTIGASRETVSRALKDLQKQGLIRVMGRKVILYRMS